MPDPKRDIRVAVVGAGYTAKEHLRAFRDCAGVTLAGIFSRTRARAETLAAEFGVATVCDSVDDLYQRTRADLVVVTVVELEMRAVATACFRHPWTVLLEKPAGYDLADARAIRDAARTDGRRVYVAFNRRAMSSTLAVRAALEATPGARFVKVQDQESQARALAAGQPPRVVDNWMFANAVHLIDYFAQFCRGAVAAVEPVVRWDAAKPGVVVAKIVFASGDLGLYEGIWHGPGPWAVSVTVPGRRWELRPLEQAVTQELGKPAETLPVHGWDASFKPGYRLQAELAVAAVAGEAPDPSRRLATLDDSMATMELVAAIFRRGVDA